MTDLAYSTAGFTRTAHSVEGVESVIYEIGDGPPVVYFHGGGTFHGFEWARDWAGDFRVILPYHPNFGESGDAPFTAIEDYADHYRRLFTTLDLTRFRLVGASMGGLLAATYAALEPERVEKLVLVSPAGLTGENIPMPNFAAIPPAELPALFVRDPAFIAPYWPESPPPDWLAKRGREAGAAARARGDDLATDALLRMRLPALTMPVLLLWGEDDRILPAPLLPSWQRALPHAQSVVIRQGGHLLLDEFPEAREAALGFLLG